MNKGLLGVLPIPSTLARALGVAKKRGLLDPCTQSRRIHLHLLLLKSTGIRGDTRDQS